jgi:osmoprotectant transport system ATP-binding protein
MIKLDQVTKRYGETLAVNDLSLEVNDGEVCVLIGPSGCGKTTTLRMVNRLVEPTSGSISVNGREVMAMNPEMLRRSIGYAIQSVGLFPHMTVAANIGTVPALLHWEKERISQRVTELLNLVGLKPAEYAGKYPAQLSGGEAQRIGVARALAADPPILLMDEPFGAVDPLTRERLQGQFLRIQAELKKTIILVTHDLDEAIRLADRIAIMNQGTLVQYDTPDAILAKPANKFVHDFVGTDRALKRLSRLTIEGIIRPVTPLPVTATPAEAAKACEECRWVWITDAGGKLLGWVDRFGLEGSEKLGDALARVDLAEGSVTPMATLREALSRILGQGVKSLPVVDDTGKLVGEVDLGDIEDATAEQRSEP